MVDKQWSIVSKRVNKFWLKLLSTQYTGTRL
jgi:hypothetical protein